MGNFPPREIEKTCEHLEWHEETKENGWRSSCFQCGLEAQGSCQEILPWRTEELSNNGNSMTKLFTKFMRWLKNDR